MLLFGKSYILPCIVFQWSSLLPSTAVVAWWLERSWVRSPAATDQSDQTGFLRDRFIGENTRLVYDIVQYCEEHRIPGLLMLIDFEKAFDSLSFNFIEKTLEYFNFLCNVQNMD